MKDVQKSSALVSLMTAAVCIAGCPQYLAVAIGW
jgi:hypothetical protein